MASFGSFKIMSVTEAAADRVRELVSKSDGKAVGLRVGVKNGGCAGMSYTRLFWWIPKLCCFCSEQKWISSVRNWRPNLCSATPTKPRPAVAASLSRLRPQHRLSSLRRKHLIR